MECSESAVSAAGLAGQDELPSDALRYSPVNRKAVQSASRAWRCRPVDLKSFALLGKARDTARTATETVSTAFLPGPQPHLPLARWKHGRCTVGSATDSPRRKARCFDQRTDALRFLPLEANIGPKDQCGAG